jgi:cation diffusion facilitator CzcD-associated flavoprotein CzcO
MGSSPSPRPAARPARVAIIGCGFSGIAAAVALQRHGISDFTIFEAAGGIGGTWWHNRYPGAEVDLESHLYSFSYARADWTRTHARWDELQRYLESVADKFGLRPHLVLNEKVESITWAQDRGEYDVVTSSGAPHASFQAVISAVGFLNIPLIPPFARGETGFGGVVCHTSRWPAGLDLAGKKVAVLGTGSSAVQVIAEAARVASELKIFQIEPNWLLPKGDRDFTARERRRGRHPLVYQWRRRRLYLQYDLRQIRASHARLGGRANRRRQRAARDFLETALASRPDLRELVTPQFPVEARRTVISDTYYAALCQPNVHLIPHAVKGLTASGAIDADGDQHEFDVIVLATGFDAANYLGNFTVTGAGGVDLHEQWGGEPQAFLGLMVPGFPNFFMLYGPNTNSAPLVSFYEAQARFAARAIRGLRRRGRRQVEVSAPLTRRYNEWLQARLATTVWAQTRSYFRARGGRIVSQWPFSASCYIMATRLSRPVATRYGKRLPQATSARSSLR